VGVGEFSCQQHSFLNSHVDTNSLIEWYVSFLKIWR